MFGGLEKINPILSFLAPTLPKPAVHGEYPLNGFLLFMFVKLIAAVLPRN